MKTLNRQFLLLWQGQLVSRIGTFLYSVALVLFLKETFTSAALISIILIAGTLPEIFLAPAGGTLADIFPKRSILIVSDIVSGLLITSFSFIMIFNPLGPVYNYICLLIISAGLGLCTSCFNPAVQALIPEMFEEGDLHTANAIFQSTGEISTILGQGLGGVLYAMLGAPMLFLSNGISFLLSAASEYFIKAGKNPGRQLKPGRELRVKFKADLKEGFLFFRRDKTLRNFLVIIALFHFFISPFPVLIPFLVTDTLKMESRWLGYLMAAFATGTLFGFILAGKLKVKEDKSRKLITLMFLLSSGLFVILGMSPSVIVSLITMMILGAIIGLVVVTLITFMQKLTPADMRGRLFGFLNLVTHAAMPAGMAVYSVCLDVLRYLLPDKSVAPKIILIFNGICILVIMITAVLFQAAKSDMKLTPEIEKQTALENEE